VARPLDNVTLSKVDSELAVEQNQVAILSQHGRSLRCFLRVENHEAKSFGLASLGVGDDVHAVNRALPHGPLQQIHQLHPCRRAWDLAYVNFDLLHNVHTKCLNEGLTVLSHHEGHVDPYPTGMLIALHWDLQAHCKGKFKQT